MPMLLALEPHVNSSTPVGALEAIHAAGSSRAVMERVA
jgi:hypothetical protein